MGTIIKSVGTARSVFNNSILALTSRATKQCLRNGGISTRDIGMLLYAGVYNENHQGEPATASLIQNRLQRDHFSRRLFSREPENIFSFDIHNGGGGILDAFRIVAGFIASGDLEYGLIAAGDTKPVSGPSHNYNYSPSAGAVLLTNGSEGKGFRRFNSKTYPEFKNDLYSSTNWNTGNFQFIIDQKAAYLEDCLICAEETTQSFLEEEKLKPEEINLLITSQSPSGFREKFIRRTGFINNITNKVSNREIYSAGLIFSMSNVFQNGNFNSSGNILFLTVGSGITVSLSLYRN
jgi:3-oxoacyl-[acyl-carrier-protein] synthase III